MICVSGRDRCDLKKISVNDGELNMEDFKFVIMKDIIKKSLLFPDKVLFMFETSVEIHWIHESRINKMKINQSTVDMTSADGSLVFILTDQGQIFFGDSRKDLVMTFSQMYWTNSKIYQPSHCFSVGTMICSSLVIETKPAHK